MKKYVYIIGVVLAVLPLCGSAQTHIKDDFLENTTLDWKEFAEKSASGLVQNGYIELISKKKEIPAFIWTDELPVMPDGDFTVKAEIIVPKLTSDYCFGVFFNRESSFPYMLDCYRFSSRKCRVVRMMLDDEEDAVGNNQAKEVDGSMLGPIKLTEGKDKTVIVEIKRLGGKTILSVNDMQVAKFKNAVETPAFGFWTPGGSSLRVTSVEVNQDYNPVTE